MEMWNTIADAWKQAARCARVMVGQPDYGTYVEHMRRHHPDQPVMSRRDFERRRQDAREHTTQARCC